MAVARHDHEQRLGGRDDAAHRMHRKLLHRAVDRRGEALQLRLSVAFTTSCSSPAAFCSAFGEVVEPVAAIGRLGLRARRVGLGDGRSFSWRMLLCCTEELVFWP